MALNLPFKVIKATLDVLAKNKRKQFIEACKNPEIAQQELKQKILKNSKLKFPEIPQSYKDLSDKVDHLTHEGIKFFETTSGSTGAKKRIPYTKSLLNSFENMFLLWAHDVVHHSDLGLQSGKFFMSISPQIGEKNTDDRQYLSLPVRTLISPFLVSDPSSHKALSTDAFFEQVSMDLLKSPDLEIISIWSPTYFLSFMEFIEANKLMLAKKIASSQTKNLLQSSELPWDKIWPKLKLVSCWNEAQAKQSSLILEKKLGHAKIQGKGLLLTEAPVTIPWSAANGNVPLITETYLEFLGSEGKILGITELKLGASYTVITSQYNGFLRYNTLDQVKVTGFYFKTPIFEFEGRMGNHSDLVGEKLSEDLIRSLLTTNFHYLLVPVQSEQPGYELYVDQDTFDRNPVEIENELLKIHHYKLARDLRQLSHLKTIKIKNLSQKYQDFQMSQGLRLGEIKERVLVSDPIQAEKFRKWIVKELQSSQSGS
jgi:hypothetical protein